MPPANQVPHSPLDDWVMFVALLATALAMGAALAHAMALPNKIAMARDDFFIAQQAYAGWDRLALLLVVQLVALIVLAALRWQQPGFVPVIVALAGLAGAQVVFWIWTFPANAATNNWTVIPDDWERLRVYWEYSHLAGFGFQLMAFCALVAAALARPSSSLPP